MTFTPPAIASPSVLDVGLHLAASEAAYRLLDEGQGKDKDDLMGLVYERQEALRVVISTLPADTLADAAVQIGVAISLAGILSDCDWREPDAQKRMTDLHDALYRISLSVLPVIASAAGLDMDAMCWDDNAQLRNRRFYTDPEARA